MMFIILPRASVAAGRLGEVIGTEPVIRDPTQPKTFSDRFVGTVEFRNVSFRYPDAEEDVLHDISFTAKPGQTTALIGSTGSGKSTVINLIPRFYDVTEGSILMDNLDIRQVTQHDLREKIGYIPQKGILFSGTIGDNLRFANENASLEALHEATDIAQAAEFISGNGKSNGHDDTHGNGGGDGDHGTSSSVKVEGDGSGDGFEAEVSQGGTNFSGGQKQRLSIARALVKKPPIYIFDDSFSAVDFKTDAALRRALKEKTVGSTILIVTQRVSTIMNAEQIIVLDEGRIIGKGTHEQLMRECKAYEEIAKSQLSQEELL
jgi:ATP-binding cassette subfamily B protein